jgi:hypothetical protein
MQRTFSYFSAISKAARFCLEHREEGNRIVREFLVGEHNAELVTMGLKSAK